MLSQKGKTMKVVINTKKLDSFKFKPTEFKNLGNPLELNPNREFQVKKVLTMPCGVCYKLALYSRPFDEDFFFVTDVEDKKVYVVPNIYTIVEDAITSDTIMKADTLNPVRDMVNLQKSSRVEKAFKCDYLNEWMFYLEGYERPIMQRYVAVSSAM